MCFNRTFLSPHFNYSVEYLLNTAVSEPLWLCRAVINFDQAARPQKCGHRHNGWPAFIYLFFLVFPPAPSSYSSQMEVKFECQFKWALSLAQFILLTLQPRKCLQHFHSVQHPISHTNFYIKCSWRLSCIVLCHQCDVSWRSQLRNGSNGNPVFVFPQAPIGVGSSTHLKIALPDILSLKCSVFLSVGFLLPPSPLCLDCIVSLPTRHKQTCVNGVRNPLHEVPFQTLPDIALAVFSAELKYLPDWCTSQ